MRVALLYAALTGVATTVGGLLALRTRDRLHLILGLAAGLMLGLVGFDLLPNVFALDHRSIGHVPVVALCFIGGFVVLHLVERMVATHEPSESEYEAHPQHHHHLGAGTATGVAMVGHVFLDGVGIGTAFHVSTGLGVAVFVALMVHAFNDGLNTVTFLIRSQQWTTQGRWLLLVDLVARVGGAAFGSYFLLTTSFVAIYLALFSGFVIYIATSHILPEAHSNHPSRWTVAMTITGVLVMWGVVALGA
jgi:ZIP family zinc transporter